MKKSGGRSEGSSLHQTYETAVLALTHLESTLAKNELKITSKYL
jgi:hypothetical protein